MPKERAPHPPAAHNPLTALTAEHPGKTPEQIVEERVEALRSDLEELGLVRPGPPYDPYAYAAALEIPVVELDDDRLSFDAVLMPQGAGEFRIGVKAAGTSPARRRFSVAHELVHTLLPDAEARAHYRLQTGGGTTADADLERLVDHGAAQLLMPARRFRADVRDMGLDPSTLMELARMYGVSLEAAAVNAVKSWDEAGFVAFCEYAYRPSTVGDVGLAVERKQWRVRRAYHSASCPVYLHRGYRFGVGSVVERVAVSGRERVGRETLKGTAMICSAKLLGKVGIKPPVVLAVGVSRSSA